LLKVEENVITIEVKGKPQQVLLNEKDELWVKFRHLHIADVLTGLGEFLDGIKARNPQAVKMQNQGGGNEPSQAELAMILRGLVNLISV
jgi:hypothetical protein